MIYILTNNNQINNIFYIYNKIYSKKKYQNKIT